MKFDLIAFLIALALWTLAYYLFIRHWLMQYSLVAGIITRVQNAENSLLAKIGLWFEAKKALLVAFLASVFGAAHSGAVSTLSAGKAAAGAVASTVNALQPNDIEALKDPSIWHGLFNDANIEMKIMSILAFITGLLAVKGHLAAAKIVPAVPTAIAVPGSAPAAVSVTPAVPSSKN